MAMHHGAGIITQPQWTIRLLDFTELSCNVSGFRFAPVRNPSDPDVYPSTSYVAQLVHTAPSQRVTQQQGSANISNKYSEVAFRIYFFFLKSLRHPVKTCFSYPYKQSLYPWQLSRTTDICTTISWISTLLLFCQSLSLPLSQGSLEKEKISERWSGQNKDNCVFAFTWLPTYIEYQTNGSRKISTFPHSMRI